MHRHNYGEDAYLRMRKAQFTIRLPVIAMAVSAAAAQCHHRGSVLKIGGTDVIATTGTLISQTAHKTLQTTPLHEQPQKPELTLYTTPPLELSSPYNH